jgi:hypothetical protein
MNLDIFFDNDYFNKLDEFITIQKVDPIFPYEEFYISPKHHKKYGTKDIYDFLVNVYFFYYYEQSYFGYTKLDDTYYIIEVDDEMTVTVAGDTEINWLKLVLDDNYPEFKKFCVDTYGFNKKEPNYTELQKIEDTYIHFN